MTIKNDEDLDARGGNQADAPLRRTAAEDAGNPIARAESGHTPGPWRVDPSYDIPTIIASCFPKGVTCVAVVYGDDDAIMARVAGASVAECIPNAYLIAAAPELLAAAQEAWEELAQCRPNDDVQRVKDQLHVAIMKARGVA